MLPSGGTMRAIKNVFVLLVILALIAGGGLITLRVLRGKPSAPDQVKPNMVAVSSIGVFMYAARAGDKVVLFDAGADPYAKPVDAALGALQASRVNISDVFITHGHGDHTAGASGLPGVKIRMGAADLALSEGKVPPEALLPKLLGKGMSFPAVTATVSVDRRRHHRRRGRQEGQGVPRRRAHAGQLRVPLRRRAVRRRRDGVQAGAAGFRR